MTTSRDCFFEGSRVFEKAMQEAVIKSENRMGVFHTGRQNRALMSFAKTITHGMSIRLIYDQAVNMRPDVGLLDHFSIGTLTRTLMDSAIMTLYLSEVGLDASAWDLRRQVLFLHDLTNRKRFLSAMRKHANEPDDPNDKEMYRRAKERIIGAIEGLGNGMGLPSERIEELTKGQIVYLDGVRGAVREAGLDVNQFDFLHTYLSNQVHGHPVSFMRADEQKISFETPSDFQFGFTGLCLEAGAEYLEAATARIEVFTGSANRDPNGQID